MIPKKAKPETIEQYIEMAPAEVRATLREVQACIRKAAPGAIEGIKWGMPAFSYQRILVTFAVFKKHIGFYPTPSAIQAFTKELAAYKTADASVQFPLDKPMPLTLVKKMTQFRVRESKEEDKKWRT